MKVKIKRKPNTSIPKAKNKTLKTNSSASKKVKKRKTVKKVTRSKIPKAIKDAAKEKKPTKKENELMDNYKKELAHCGLKREWVMFIDEYLRNGFNATQAYMKAYPECKETSAIKQACLLLKNSNIRNEINNIMETQLLTDNWVLSVGKEYVMKGLIDEKWAKAGSSVLEMFAKSKGMLTDIHRHEFDNDNPAIITIPVSPERQEEIAKMGRLVE